MMKTDDINDQAITKDKIRDGNITSEKLADGAVSTDKLPDGAIKTPKIADENITTSKLAEASVVTSKIADQNVTKEKIADQSVDNSKLSPSAVTYDKVKDKAIITEKLNDRSVTTEKVEEKAITNAKIGDSAVDGRVISEASVEKKHLANDSVATEKLQDSAITSDKIHIHAVTEEKIKDSAISNSKLAENSVGTSKIKDGNVTNEKVANNTLTIDKLDPELRKSIQAATGLPENLVEVIQDVDVEVKSLHTKDEDLQSQITDKQQQITAHDKDIESLQNRSTQMEQSINNIAVTGGASVANTVAYSNTASGLVSINAQGAIDELAAKNATKAEKAEVKAELEKKFNKESILQESGEAEDKVMSQKAVSNKLSNLSARQHFVDNCLRQIYVTESDFESYEKVIDKLGIYHLGIPNLSNMNYTYAVEEPWAGYKPRTYKFKDTDPKGNRYTSFLLKGDPSDLNGDFCNARVWDADGNFIWSAKLARGTWELSLPLGYEIELYQNIGSTSTESDFARMKQKFFEESGYFDNSLRALSHRLSLIEDDSLLGSYLRADSPTATIYKNIDKIASWSALAAISFIDLSSIGFAPKTIKIENVTDFAKGVVEVALCKNDDIRDAANQTSDNYGLLVDIKNPEMNSAYDSAEDSVTLSSDDYNFSTYPWLIISFSLTDNTVVTIDGKNMRRIVYGIKNKHLELLNVNISNEATKREHGDSLMLERQQFVDNCLRQIYVTESDFESYEKVIDKLGIYHLGIPNLSNMNYTYAVEEPWAGYKPRTYKFKDTDPKGNRYTSFLLKGDPSDLNGDFCNARVWDADGNFIWSAKLARGTWELSLPLGYEIELYQNIGSTSTESDFARMKQKFFEESERGNAKNGINPWAGKCIAFYGDSVTYIGQGTGTSMGHASRPFAAEWGNNWQLYIAKYLDLKEFYSRGVGSAMYEYQDWVQYAHTETGYSGDRPYPFISFDKAEEKEGFTKTHGYLAAWDRIKAQFPASIKDTIDAIFITDSNSASNHTSDDFETPAFIEGATKDSDWAADSTYNVFGGDYDITTFAGAICSMIMKLQAWMPNAQIIIGSQISGRGDDSISGAVSGRNFTKLDEARRGMYCAEKTRKVAGMMSIPYIPVWETMSVNPLNRNGKISDIVHPYTKAGGYRVGKTIAQYLMNFTPSEPPV